MVVPGTLVSSAATGTGFLAAAIAVCGFLAHAWPAMVGKDEVEIRRATVIGGLGGFAVALFAIAIPWVVG